MSNILVVGVDPAPSKGLCVSFPPIGDGPAKIEHFRSTTEELEAFANRIKKLATDKAVLICWDSPLTFGEQPASANYAQNQHYRRPIEDFFSKLNTNASVQAYAGCPHWAITQRVLGYPSWSAPEAIGRPLVGVSKLLTDNVSVEAIKDVGVYVTEVHPALAMSLLGDKQNDLVRQYKGRKKPPKESEIESYTAQDKKDACHTLYKEIWKEGEPELCELSLKGLQLDDVVDAYCARRLGEQWIERKGACCVGNLHTGSFLLPSDAELLEELTQFLESLK